MNSHRPVALETPKDIDYDLKSLNLNKTRIRCESTITKNSR